MRTTLTDVPPLQDIHAILSNCPQAIVHSTPEWAIMLGRCVRGTCRWLMAYDAGTPVGMLPFFELETERWGTVVNSHPFFGTHGGCLVRDTPQSNAVRQTLLQAFAQHTQALPRFISASISVSFLEYTYINIYRKTLCPDTEDSRIAQIYALPKQNILETILKKHTAPRMIRKSLRQNFSTCMQDSDQSWEYLHKMQEKNMLAKGMLPKTAAQITALRTCLRPEQRELHVAWLGSNPVAALLVLLHRPWVHYAIPVFDMEYASLQPMTALIYTAMCAYAAQGYTHWSFGGTPLNNVSLHRFKATWGAEDCHYCYVTNISSYGKNIFAQHSKEILHDFKNYYVCKTA